MSTEEFLNEVHSHENDKNLGSSIPIENKVFESILEINGEKFNKDISFLNCEFAKGFSINGCNFNRILIDENCILDSKGSILSSNLLELHIKTGHILIQSCIISNELRIHNSNSVDLTIYRCYLHCFKIEENSNASINFPDNNSLVKSLVISGLSDSLSFVAARIKINSIVLSGELSNETRIQFNGVTCNYFLMNNLVNNGSIIFNQLNFVKDCYTFNTISLSEFVKQYSPRKLQLSINDYNSIIENYTNTLLININISTYFRLIPFVDRYLFKVLNNEESTLIFNSIELGNIKLDSVNFSNLSHLKIKNTSLKSLELYNSKIPINLIDHNDSTYEIFNELYSIAKSKNNKEEEINYYKASQEALIKKNKFFKDTGTLLALYTSKFYSSFGTYWWQAFFISIALGFLFFSFMMLSTTYDIDLDFSSKSLNNFWRLKADFAKFMNPTHKLTFMDVKDVYRYSDQFWFIIWDSLGRIFIGIGIFETIRSFRKYTRK